jgi:hypothetical protein
MIIRPKYITSSTDGSSTRARLDGTMVAIKEGCTAFENAHCPSSRGNKSKQQ